MYETGELQKLLGVEGGAPATDEPQVATAAEPAPLSIENLL
jgi:hypothetical protein